MLTYNRLFNFEGWCCSARPLRSRLPPGLSLVVPQFRRRQRHKQPGGVGRPPYVVLPDHHKIGAKNDNTCTSYLPLRILIPTSGSVAAEW